MKTKQMNHMQVEMDITLQTYNAQNYVWGHRKGVLGLFQFARNVTQLLKASKKDDPYADWFLTQIQDALIEARHKLQRYEKRYREILAMKKNQKRVIVPLVKPSIIKARFSSPCSFVTADMIGDYDRTLSLIKTAQYTGIFLDKPYQEIESSLSKIVDLVMNLPKRWQSTNVTRLDITQNTELAQQACFLMGEIPSKFLEKNDFLVNA